MNAEDEFVHDETVVTYLVKASKLRKNGYAILKEYACRIYDINKNGNKVHIFGIEVFTGHKHDELFEPESNVSVPNVIRKEYQALNVEDGDVDVMSEAGEVLSFSCISAEVAESLRQLLQYAESVQVTCLTALGNSKIISSRAA